MVRIRIIGIQIWKIVKNLTIIGVGNAILSRENDRNIFIVKEWGSLTLKNLNFTINLKQYSNELILVKRGKFNSFKF